MVINKGLRFIHCNENQVMTIKELHEKNNITLFNISIYNKMVKTWQTIQHTDEEQ